MVIEAAHAVADQVTPEQLKQGMLYPPQSNILEAEVRTAERVAALVFERNLARVKRPKDINSWLREMLYKAQYPALTQ
jgi:malate dehydrogenase (oxaloacetate-decarboxylating)(NADP+)